MLIFASRGSAPHPIWGSHPRPHFSSYGVTFRHLLGFRVLERTVETVGTVELSGRSLTFSLTYVDDLVGGFLFGPGPSFRWLRVKFPLDWKSGVLSRGSNFQNFQFPHLSRPPNFQNFPNFHTSPDPQISKRNF